MLKVFVEEEFGYRYWLWEFPGTAEELVADWKDGKAPLFYFDPSKSPRRGTMTDLTEKFYDAGEDFYKRIDEIRESADAFVHTHEVEDTYLVIGNRMDETAPHHRHPKWKGVEVNCPKCGTRNVFKNPEIAHTDACWSCGFEPLLGRC